MESTFFQLAAILAVAFIVSYIIRLLKQPVIVGYILAGIIASPFLVSAGTSKAFISILSDLGISFLLFMVGLHLNPKVIKEIGVSSLFVGIGQILLTFGATFAVARYLLGAELIVALYYGIGIAFSSTIIIMKILSDQKQLDSLHGKLVTGILILQDLVAVGVLMLISSVSGLPSHGSGAGFEGFIIGGATLVGLFLVGYLILPRALKSIAKSQELLFLFSIAWCFGLGAVFSYIGFSMEIGSLVAGIILSSSQYSTEISSKIKPLRDFFLMLFFIILGFKIQISSLKLIIVDALVLSALALIVKPIIIMALMRGFGYTKRTNFLVSSSLAQISEFSLIIFALGVSVGQIPSTSLNVMILTLVLTIFFSSYFMNYGNKIYRVLSPFLSIFQKKKLKKVPQKKETYDTILFGYNRIGFSILKTLKKMKRKYLVVDFNPDIVKVLKKYEIPALYGDVYDADFLDELPLKKAELIISTIPDLETNELLLDVIKDVNRKAVIILRANTIEDALQLYKEGANYVLTPHFLGGEYVARMIRHVRSGDEDYSKEKKKHLKVLREIEKQNGRGPHV